MHAFAIAALLAAGAGEATRSTSSSVEVVSLRREKNARCVVDKPWLPPLQVPDDLFRYYVHHRNKSLRVIVSVDQKDRKTCAVAALVAIMRAGFPNVIVDSSSKRPLEPPW
jgi:hypothetical protein